MNIQTQIDALIEEIRGISAYDDGSDDFVAILDELHADLDALYTELDS